MIVLVVTGFQTIPFTHVIVQALEGTPLTITSGTLSAGTYYLEDDLLLTDRISIRSTVTIDLNGHLLIAAYNKGIFDVQYGTLNIKDSNPDAAHYYKVVDNYYCFGERGEENTTYVPFTEETDGVSLFRGGVLTGAHNGASGSNGGGTIYLKNNAYLNLYSGSIAGNYANFGGGVNMRDNSELNMYGGKIAGNISVNSGAAIDSWGYVAGMSSSSAKSVVNIHNGTITDNKQPNGYGTISVQAQSTLNMYGGSIKYNDCKGVVLRGGASAKFNMIDGEISHNQECAVNITLGYFEMQGGSIEYNSSGYNAGGVYIYDGGTFEMKGGNISHNSCTGRAGGVTVGQYGGSQKGTFIMSGGSIDHNTSETAVGGVAVYGQKKVMKLYGTPIINDNLCNNKASDVLLNDNNVITIEDSLTVDEPIGVNKSSLGVFTSGWNDKMGEEDPADYFVSQRSKYEVTRTEEGEGALTKIPSTGSWKQCLKNEETPENGWWYYSTDEETVTYSGGTSIDDNPSFAIEEIDEVEEAFQVRTPKYSARKDGAYTFNFACEEIIEDGYAYYLTVKLCNDDGEVLDQTYMMPNFVEDSDNNYTAECSFDVNLEKGDKVYLEAAAYTAESQAISFSLNIEAPEINYIIKIDNDIAAKVPEGETYTFPISGEKYFEFGYIDADNTDNVYIPGTTITPESDMNFIGINSLVVTSSNAGSCIRLDRTDPGISFGATALLNNTGPVISAGFTYGMLLTANDFYTEYYNNTLDFNSQKNGSGKVLNIIFDSESDWISLEEGKYRAGIIHITERNLSRFFIGRAYATINYTDGDTRIIYSSNTTESRSVKQVAGILKKDTDYYNGLEENERVAIDAFETVK